MDWSTFLTGLPIGAVAGYLGTLFSDPMKKTINDGRLRRLLRKNLYREIAYNYVGLIMFLTPEKLSILEHRFAENIGDYAQTSVFDYAEKQQEIALRIKEWSTIEQIYKSLKKILKKQSPELSNPLVGASYAAILGKNLISLIEEAGSNSSLSIRLFSKVSPDISKRMWEIKNGRRRKSSEIYAEIDKRQTDEFFSLMTPPRPPPPMPR